MATEGEVCKPIQFRDANGDQKTGSKDCGASDIKPWDLRAGVIAGGKMGMLKVNCRNRANLDLQDMDTGRSVYGIASDVLTTTAPHGLGSGEKVRLHYVTAPTGANNYTTYYVISASATTLQLSTSSGTVEAMPIAGGTGITVHRWQDGTADIWDTIDDNNNGLSGIPGTLVSGWSDNDCGGVETVAGDSNVWKDVTTPSSCASAASANCTMQDKITGLWWSKIQYTSRTWSQAINDCEDLTHNFQTDWRLPTQKELLDAYNHGIRSAESSDWIDDTQMSLLFWSASTDSSGADSAWAMKLAKGFSNPLGKIIPLNVVCVRP
jgi:hypothetical protein